MNHELSESKTLVFLCALSEFRFNDPGMVRVVATAQARETGKSPHQLFVPHYAGPTR